MIHIPRNQFVFVLLILSHMGLSYGRERRTATGSTSMSDFDVDSTQDPGSGYSSNSMGYHRTNQFSNSDSSDSLVTTTKTGPSDSDDQDDDYPIGEEGSGSDGTADLQTNTPGMRTSEEPLALTSAAESGIILESEGPCSENMFGCDNGKCIHKAFQCSAEHLRQCANDTSLNNCPAPEAGNCRRNEFKCWNGNCIHRSLMCDRQNDCWGSDHSDEANCKDVRCLEYEFECRGGACIPDSGRCNGDPFDCVNGDDEENCTSCTHGAFKCTNGNDCILESRLCDSVFDCPDGSDESQVHCPNGTTPPKWTEFWHDDPKKARNISLAYSDEHVVIYFGQEMGTFSTTWPFPLLSKAWKYMTTTYADVSRQSRLLVLLHENTAGGCETQTFGGFPSRNLISCRTNDPRGWAAQTALKFETLFRNFGSMSLNSDKELSFNEEGNQSGRCSNVHNLIFYDIYQHLEKASTHLPPWNQTMLNDNAGENPNETITCFQDWFLPIYESCGRSTLIQRYLKYFPDALSWSPSGKTLSTGQYVHLWSEAAGTDLQPMAARVFSWSANDLRDLLSARQRHPLDLSYTRNEYVVTYADEHVQFYMRNHLNDFLVSPLYEALSKSWKYLKSVYGPFRRTSYSIFFVWQDGEWEERNRSCIDSESTQTLRNSSDSPPLRFLHCSYSTALPNSSFRAYSTFNRVLHKISAMAVNLHYKSRSPPTHIHTSPLLDNPQWHIIQNVVHDIDFHLYQDQKQSYWSDLSMEIKSELKHRLVWDEYINYYTFGEGLYYRHIKIGPLVRVSNEIAISLRVANASEFNVGDFIHVFSNRSDWSEVIQSDLVNEFGWNKLNESLFLEERRLLQGHTYSDLRCPESEFTCMNLDCVPTSARCDGVLDCEDGSDEEDCTNCTSTAVKCPASDICIKGTSRLCNFHVDCPNGSDESSDTCPDGSTPFFLTLDHEAGPAERKFLSPHLAVYLGERRNSSLAPHFPLLSQAWRYVKETLIPEGDPHLIILLQHNSFSSCSAVTHLDQQFGYRNLIKCEKRPGNSTDQYSLILGTFLKLVATAVLKKSHVELEELCELEIGILCFDRLYTTRHGNKTDAGDSSFSSWWNQVMHHALNSSDCYQHWLHPIYSNYGGSAVLDRFCGLRRLHWPQKSRSTISITYNAERLVHFWSEAAGTDLQDFANTAFSSSIFDRFKYSDGFPNLLHARRDFHYFNYTVMNYTLAYSDDRLLFYYQVNFPSPPLSYRDVSRAWAHVYSVLRGSGNAPGILVFLENRRTEAGNGSFLRMCVPSQSFRHIPRSDRGGNPHPDRDCGEHDISGAFPSAESEYAELKAVLTQTALLGLELYGAGKTALDTAHTSYQLLSSILVHDIYLTVVRSSPTVHQWSSEHVSTEKSFLAEGSTLGFRNWYVPIYHYHDETIVLRSFFRHWNSIKRWPQQGLRGNAHSDLNPGEFVHLWSLAVNFNLERFANVSLGGSLNESFQTQFATARRTENSKRGYINRCPAGRFLCDLHRCEGMQDQCDGVLDCEDGSDEEGCAETGCKIAFLCHNGQCVKSSVLCDGTRNCRDNSDEANCTQCSSNAFKCHTATECIELSRVCDSTPDCSDGSDENQVQCPVTTTSANFSPSVTSPSLEKTGTESYGQYSSTYPEPNYQNVRFKLRSAKPTAPILRYYEETSKAWQYARDNFGAFTRQTNASLLVMLENTLNKSTQAPHCFSSVENGEFNEININCRFSSTLHPQLEASLLLQETVKQMGVALLPGNGVEWFFSNDPGLAISSIIAYDIQLAGLGGTEETLQRLHNSLKKNEAPSGDGIRWFRDWYSPLYVLHGNSTVLLRAMRILNNQFNWGAQAKITSEARAPINKGELVHIWSGAVCLSLREIAQVTLNWTQENDREFYRARQQYVNITYEIVNSDEEATNINITHAQSDAQILVIVEPTLGRAQLLKCVYADEHVSIFFDSSIPPSVDWPFSLLSTYWRYMKLFPNKLQSSKPHLNVVFHDKLEKNCTYSESFQISGQLFSNTIDCGQREGSGDSWAQETLQNLEIVTTTSTVKEPRHTDSSVSEAPQPDASPEQNKAEAEDIPFSLAGHALFHMFVFDRYLQDMRLEEAHSWLLDKGERIRVAEFNSHFWFKDWLLPMYSKYGGVFVLNRFVNMSETRKRMLRATRNSSVAPTDVRMNLGELVHVWESAAGAPLRDIAIKIHRWNDDAQKQFCDARAALPFNSSTNEEGEGADDGACKDQPPPDFVEDTLFPVILPSLAAFFILGCVGCGLKMFIYERRIQMLGQQIRDLTKEEVYQFFNGGAGGDGAGNGPIHAMPFDSQYELPREDFVIDKDRVLGSGEFGVVHFGTLKRSLKPLTGTVVLGGNDAETGTEVAVAIKTVKPNVEVSLFKALLMEIKIMGHLGSHPNVTSLLGTFTQNIKNRELYVILEFCAKGDLLHELKNQRAQFCNLFNLKDEGTTSAPTAAGNQMPIPMPHVKVVTNNSEAAVAVERETTPAPSYENETDSTSPSAPRISTINLIDWSIQIAQGMTYLASKQVIHGDLAARNVLLTVENVAKISDFGLSRQLVNYSNYMKTSKTPLPWRWLAVESLTDMEFSLQSDIWAFGVTLWEIFTLGKLPYPGRTWDHEFVDELTAGQRLNAPEFGDEEIFNCILDCMRTDPAQRASSAQIAARLQRVPVYAKAHAQMATTCDQSGNYLTLVAPNANAPQ